MERKKIPQEQAAEYQKMNYAEVKDKLPDAWTPAEFHKSSEQDFFKLN